MRVTKKYAHQRWEGIRKILKFLIHTIGYRTLAKFESVEGLENIPDTGPGIILYNHIAFIDPVAVLSTIKRNVVPIAKIESFSIPFFGMFAQLWGSIPIKRGEVDREALEAAFRVLDVGELLLLAPEGTRNPALIEAKDGVAYIAARANVPIIPVAVEGTEGFPSLNPKRWKLPGVTIRFGKPFRFKPQKGKIGKDMLKQMTKEAMYQLAKILPPERRGFYSDVANATSETIAI